MPGELDRTHLRVSRGQVHSRRSGDRAVVPESRGPVGRFGRMFPNLPSFEPSDDEIEAYAAHLHGPDSSQDGDNRAVPAGFTYLGQFIDHDLTFDPASSLDRQNDPDGLRNFRTPNFDLDSVYGLGRDDQPYLYDPRDPALFQLGRGLGKNEEDLPRILGPEEEPKSEDERLARPAIALIGDPRNDENVIVSQLHLALIKLHNRLVNAIRNPGRGDNLDLRPHLWSTGDAFEEAQRLTRWHYQWVVLKDFLPRICGPGVLGELLVLVSGAKWLR